MSFFFNFLKKSLSYIVGLAAQAAATPVSSGVKGASQEGIDRTSLDLQLAGSSAPQEASTSTPTDFATIAKTVPKSKSLLVLFEM